MASGIRVLSILTLCLILAASGAAAQVAPPADSDDSGARISRLIEELLRVHPTVPLLASREPVTEEESEIGHEGTDDGEQIDITAPISVSVSPIAAAGDISITLYGDALQDASATATATTTGVAAGAGDDTVNTSSSVSASSYAWTAAGTVSLELADNAAVDATMEAIATATGVDGGAGDDTITNADSVTGGSVAIVGAGGIDAAFIDGTGAGSVEMSLIATATSVGIDGGDGDDTISNGGTIWGTSGATGGYLWLAGEFVGDTAADGSITALADATGIAGSAGSDTITNADEGSINVLSIAEAASDEFTTSTITGFTNAETGIQSEAVGVGIDGGEGDDTITNDGSVVVTTIPTTLDNGISQTLLALDIDQAPEADSSPIAIGHATGLAGGDGDDTITNTGVVTATSVPVVEGESVETQVFGLAKAIAVTRADGTAIGIDGGDGDDTIRNEKTVNATAVSTVYAGSIRAALKLIPLSVFGSAEADAIASALAVGIAGGEGDDHIVNTSAINATSVITEVETELQLTAGISFTSGDSGGDFAGAPTAQEGESPEEGGADEGTASASTQRLAAATGISGGDGDDIIENQGTVNVGSVATTVAVEANGSLSVTLTVLDAEEDASGRPGLVAQEGEPEVEVDAVVTTTASAAGIDGGTGNDTITNTSTVDVDATAVAVEVSGGLVISIPANPLSLLIPTFFSTDASRGNRAIAAGIVGGDGDDTITNAGTVDVDAGANTDTVSVTLAGAINVPVLFGGGMANATSVTEATALGIVGDGGEGEAGNDTINSTGTVDTYSNAVAVGVSVNAALAGGILGNTATTAHSTSIGIDGGGGDDTIGNWDVVKAIADATGVVVSVVAELFPGAAISNGNTDIVTSAKAIIGGEGNDTIGNFGSLTSEATSVGNVTTVDVILSEGASIGNIATVSEAIATGVDAGDGDDTINSQGTIAATAEAFSGAQAVAVEVFAGAAIANSAGTEATATANGIDAGAGNDTIDWSNLISATSTSNAHVTEVTAEGIGGSVGFAGVGSTATSTGIDGGEGDDTITGLGEVTASSTATVGAVSVNVNGTGGSVGNLQTSISAESTGVSGGDGNDTIEVSGVTNAIANANTGEVGVSVNLIGAAVQVSGTAYDASIGVVATAEGLSGGDGNDTIISNGELNATANATAIVDEVSVNLIGAAVGDATTDADATANGISGGDGNDTIENHGTMTLEATASGEASTVDVEIAGGSSGNAAMTADAFSIGIDSGDGADGILNTGEIGITTLATQDADGDSFTLAGAAFTGPGVTSNTVVNGIRSFEGDTSVTNQGHISLSATASADFSDSAVTIFGASSDNSLAGAGASITGIFTGYGNDVVLNEGTLTGTATASSTAQNGSAFTFLGSAATGASMETWSWAAGIRTSVGDDQITNTGLVSVFSSAATTLSGSSVDIGGAAASGGNGRSTAEAVGIDAGRDENTVLNEGTLEAGASASASSNGTSGTGAGYAGTTSTLTSSAETTGIASSIEQDTVTNAVDGDIIVNATATATDVGSGVSVLGYSLASGRATTTATATGVMTERGGDTITNAGYMEVNGMATTTVSANTSWVLIGAADSVANSTATSIADGIWTNGGDTTIDNSGNLLVMATATATATATSSGGLADADADADATATATASGVRTGGDNDTIDNGGTIDVSATATATSTATNSAVSGTTSSDATASATAIGIDTGAGDDVVTNNGTVVVSTTATANDNTGAAADQDAIDGESEAESRIAITTGAGADTVVNEGVIESFGGTAIDTGDDDDLVRLIGDSEVGGFVYLGSGDDVITFGGDALVAGQIQGQAGWDTLRLEDEGRFVIDSADLTGVEMLEVNRGTLELRGDTTLLDGGGLQAELFDGGAGQLIIGGDATIGADNEIILIAAPRAYLDGDSFDLLVADAINGSFATEDLTSSRFLDFSLEYLPTAVRAHTAVVPFADVAANQVEDSVAGYLDGIAPSAAGDLSYTIGEFQLLFDEKQIGEAFASLSPEAHDGVTRSSLEVSREQGRSMLRQAATARRSVTIDDERGLAIWGGILGQWGEQDAKDGFSGLDYSSGSFAIGADHPFGSFLGGVSLGLSQTDVTLDDSRGGSDIDSFALSLYGSWFGERAWADAALSFGSQSYDSQRRVSVGDDERTALGDHDGSSLALHGQGGYRFDLFESWELEPFGRMHYIRLGEDAFTESGADSVNLIVDSRSTTSLVTDIGARFTGHMTTDTTAFRPRFAVAWVHDFDIDDRTIVWAYTGDSDSAVSLDGLQLDQDRLRLEAGVGIESGRIEAAVDLFGEFAGDHSAAGIFLSVGATF